VTKLRPIAAAALLAAGLALGGCITLFPKSSPVQLYRFGDTAPAVDAKAAAQGAPFSLHRTAIVFERAALSDAILTSNGTETAYLAGARWVAPATVLFDEEVDRAFHAAGGPAQLVPRGEMGAGGASLKLDVEIFEARYSGGKDAAPTVVVRLHALLARVNDRQVLAEKVFDVQKPAEANRIGPIVAAFDAAATDAVGQLVAWAEVEGEPTADPQHR
jgi:cholesterol transport system auxiliary component